MWRRVSAEIKANAYWGFVAQYVTVIQRLCPAVTLTHDGNGNLTGEGTWAFAYDAENRLRTANRAGTAASYLYDPLGRRQAKIVNGVTTAFLNDGAEEVTEYTGAGVLLRRYIPGPGTDQPIAMITPAGAGQTRSYFHVNRQGSTVAMSNDAGTVSEGPYTYDAYGQGAGSAGVPFKYTGRRLDPETGLYYYRARYYSAALGRFLQTDPIGYADQMNLYGYVNNDPGNFTDPSGLDKWAVGGDVSLVGLVGAKVGIEFSYDDETGEVAVTVTVGARGGLQAGAGGSFSRTDSATEATPDGVSGEISVNVEGSIPYPPVGGQYELGSVNDKWEKKGAGKDKEKVKPKWSGEFKGKAGASVGFDLKVSVKGTVGGRSDSKKPSSTGKSQNQPRTSAPKCDASNCPKGK